MFDWDVRRGTAGLGVLMQMADERGMTAAEYSAGTTLPLDAVLAPGAAISAREELRVLRNLLARCGGEPGLGVETGRRDHLSLGGAWGLALISSRTLRDAVDVLLRYVDQAVVLGRLTLEEYDGMARLRFDGSRIPEDVRTFVAERMMTGIHIVGQDLFAGGLPISAVRFRHSAPADLARHRAVFGREPEFGADADECVFDSAYLDTPLPRLNDRVRGAGERLCRDLLHSGPARTGVAEAVCDLLVRNPGEVPDQLAVANGLFMSPRTLSRRLRQEGTSFRTLVDEVRHVLSVELLAHTDITTEQVAARLGYAEAASFIRAFRRWAGCPPQQYRLRGPGPEVRDRPELADLGR